MRIPTPGCVRKTLALLITTLALSLTFAAGLVYYHLQTAATAESEGAVARNLALLLAGHLADNEPQTASAPAEWRLPSIENMLRAAAVWRVDRPQLAAGPTFGDAGELLAPPPDLRAGQITVRRVAAPADDPRPVWQQVDIALNQTRAEKPLVASFLIATDPGQGASLGDLWTFVAPVMAVAAAGLLTCWWCADRDILKPLTRLNAIVNAPTWEAVADASIESRDDVLGQIARGIGELHRDAVHWRRRAESVEKQVDSQVAVRTEEVNKELQATRKQLWEDPLTGVKNRRLFDERFPRIFRAQRDARSDLSVIVLDIDHFKKFNDTLGHAAGDHLLKFVGVLLKQFIRQDDLAIRLGGDEFLLVLPGVPRDRAEAMAQRLSALFAQYTSLIHGVQTKPGISAGVAGLREDDPADPLELIATADRKMYAHKWKASAKRARTSALAG